MPAKSLEEHREMVTKALKAQKEAMEKGSKRYEAARNAIERKFDEDRAAAKNALARSGDQDKYKRDIEAAVKAWWAAIEAAQKELDAFVRLQEDAYKKTVDTVLRAYGYKR